MQTPLKLSARVSMFGNRPTLFINDEPKVPILYSLTDAPGGRWTWEEMPAWNIRCFGEAGIHLHQVDFSLQHVWMEGGSIDMTIPQRQLQGVLDADPEACIMIRFHINAPDWWDIRYPEECFAYADTPSLKRKRMTAISTILTDNLEPVPLHSFASIKWREEAGEAYRQFLKLMEEMPQGDRVFSIQVADGVYGEWHPFGFLEHDPDISQPMEIAFRKWLKDKYSCTRKLREAWRDELVDFDNVKIPGSIAREHTGDGVFRIPSQEMPVIDYYECLHDVVSESILLFCRITKMAWSRPIVTAAFYGYFYSLFGRQAAGGHLGIQRVLESEDIDCLCAPQSYVVQHRQMGGSGQSRALLESARLHGKLTLDEMDQPPFNDIVHAHDRDLVNRTLKESLSILRRNVLASISRGMGMWYYDFGPRNTSGWWMRPEFLKEIEQLYSLLGARIKKDYTPMADVLVVYDAKSSLYTANKAASDPITDPIALNMVSTALYKSGVCFDTIYLFDLPRVDLSRYRAVVFVNTYHMSEPMHAFIRDRVASDHRHILWFYAPDGVGEAGADAARISEITGIQIARCDCVRPLQITPCDETLPYNLDLRKQYNDLYYMFEQLDCGKAQRFAPTFEVKDKDAYALGRYVDTEMVAFACKKMENWTSWYCAVPLADGASLRAIFRLSGAHIYSDGEDSLLIGSGLVCIHTALGGLREITLKMGKGYHFIFRRRKPISWMGKVESLFGR